MGSFRVGKNIGARLINQGLMPYGALDEIVTILGGTKMALWPFLSGVGTDVFPYGSGNDGVVATPSDEAGAVALEAEFDPVRLPGGIYAYYFDSSANNHLNGGDTAAYSHGDGSTDDAFSLGLWVLPTVAANTHSLIAKYGSTANLEEFDLRVSASAVLLELHDASASASEIVNATANSVLAWSWKFIVATYDGSEATPDVHIYVDGVDLNPTGATTETGSYVAMENTTSGLLIGARDATGTPAQEFEGYMALPFITGKELAADEVTRLYQIGRQLIGLGPV